MTSRTTGAWCVATHSNEPLVAHFFPSTFRGSTLKVTSECNLYLPTRRKVREGETFPQCPDCLEWITSKTRS